MGVAFVPLMMDKAKIPSQFSSVAQSCPALQPHGLQYSRPPCPSPTPGVYSNSCPLSRWCHPTISSSVVPFSSHIQSFPASGSFLMSQFFASGGQSIGVSASASVLPMNIQDWFPLGWTGWISLLSKGLSRVFSNTTVYGVGVNHSHKGDMYSRHIPGACSLRLCTQRGGKTCPQTLNFQHQTQFLSVKWVDVDEWKSGLGCLRLSYTSYKSNVFPSPLPPL